LRRSRICNTEHLIADYPEPGHKRSLEHFCTPKNRTFVCFVCYNLFCLLQFSPEGAQHSMIIPPPRVFQEHSRFMATLQFVSPPATAADGTAVRPCVSPGRDATKSDLYPVYTVEQTSSRYEACIKHGLHEATIKQTSSWLVQLTYSLSS